MSKMFVVSEEELERLQGAAFGEAVDQWEGNELNDNLEQAKAACRARPVGFLDNVVADGKALWVEVDK